MKETQEKVLKGRRRKKASKGKTLRLSDDVLAFLNQRRCNGNKRKAPSWDCFFRSIFGLPDRNGDPQTLIEGWVEQNSSTFFKTQAEANGRAVLEMAKRGKRVMSKPVRVREVRW